MAFFPIVVCLYFLLPFRFRWMLLLLASYYFYGCWRVEYVFLMIFTTVVDWYAAIRMDASPEKRDKRRWLLLSLTSNLSILFFFKYSGFFSDSLRYAFSQMNILVALPELRFLLPVGISFYTFQSIGYTVDVYRGAPAEKHLGIFALYVAFFPQMVAGPIERAAHLLPQYREKHTVNWARIGAGLTLIVWGMFKKVIIADRLALAVNHAYGQPGEQSGLTLLAATYCFALQIYCDFSGYSDIAIGSARVMGYELMENFRRPYLAVTLSDFWRRWHIALSTWFRDYLYLPLGGNRVPLRRWCYNILIVFLVSGLWHGANWTYIVWGAIHGLGLVTERLLGVDRLTAVRGKLSWLLRPVMILYTFHLVLLGWIFFRAASVSAAWTVVQKVVLDAPAQLGNFLYRGSLLQLVQSLGITLHDARIAVTALALLALAEVLQEAGAKERLALQSNWAVRTCQIAFTYCLALLTAAMVAPESQQFIYFQF